MREPLIFKSPDVLKQIFYYFLVLEVEQEKRTYLGDILLKSLVSKKYRSFFLSFLSQMVMEKKFLFKFEDFDPNSIDVFKLSQKEILQYCRWDRYYQRNINRLKLFTIIKNPHDEARIRKKAAELIEQREAVEKHSGHCMTACYILSAAILGIFFLIFFAAFVYRWRSGDFASPLCGISVGLGLLMLCSLIRPLIECVDKIRYPSINEAFQKGCVDLFYVPPTSESPQAEPSLSSEHSDTTEVQPLIA